MHFMERVRDEYGVYCISHGNDHNSNFNIPFPHDFKVDSMKLFDVLDISLGMPLWFIEKYRWNRKHGDTRRNSARKALWHLGIPIK